MKKTRLLFALLVALVMVAISPQKVWAWGGSGSSSSPYTISSAADLQKFANIVNGANGETRNVAACAKLTADITLSGTWTAMGTDASGRRYTGTFDGNGKTISGMSITATADNQGFFGYVDGATIKNLTLAGSISAGGNQIGSVAGLAKGNTQILDVVSKVNITMTATKNHIGGIVGQLATASGDVPTISGCTYSGTMNLGSCSDSNGGIVGYCYKNAQVTITYCHFAGSITTSASNPTALGGILGYADDDGTHFKALSNCFVSGTISPKSGTNVGAIAGQPKGSIPNVTKNNNYISGVAANALGNSKTSATSTPITISVTAGANGSVSQSYVNPTSTTATQLQVVATPSAHYHFGSWNDSGAQTHNVGLTANVGLSASFVIDQHTITVKTNDSNMGTVSGGGTYDYGSTKTITATPKTHYHFVKWDDGDTNASRTITVTGDKTYTATFAIDQHTITVKPNDNNMGSVSGGGTFDYNSKQTIKATPKTHYHFVKWDDGDTNASRQITVTGDKTYTATFAIDQHTITVKANNSNYGSVSGGGTFDYNTKQTITATAKSGYHFVKWSDGDTNASRQITVTANATYTATFEAHSFGEWITDTPATCTVAGSKHRECTHTGCQGSEEDVIPALGHGTEGYNFYYGNGIWNDGWGGTYDAPTVTAKLYCKKCKNYAFDDYITPTKVTERHIDATCAANGNETWQAILVYNNDGDVPYTSEPTTKDYAIPAKGHVATQDFDENGFAPCSACGGEAHQPANCIDLNEYSPKYDIANAGQLYWFAELVNTGERRAVGYLTADIVVNDGTFDADGNFTARGASTPSTPRSWTPIGNGDFDHAGWFDGQGHTISGLYFNDPNTTRVGFMGRHAGSGILNLGIINCYFKGKNSVGGIVGYSSGPIIDCYATDCYINGNALVGGICGYLHGKTLRNCWSDCDVIGRENTAGGICGMVLEANLTDCYSMGTVTGNSYAGGIVGRNMVLNNGRKSFVYNCYTIATVNGEGLSVGSICGANVFRNEKDAQTVVKNCYSNNTSSLQAIGKNEDEDYTDGTTVYLCETGVSADRFASGEIAYKLNGSVDDAGTWTPGATDGTQAWYQQLGTDSYPSLEKDGDDNTVYTYTDCQSLTVYTNDANCTDGHQWGDDRICTICHQARKADYTGTCGTCTWSIYEDGLMLIEPTEGESGKLGYWEYNFNDIPWYPHSALITSVEIRGEVIATTCFGMFAYCSNLRSISWGGFNTAEVVDMAMMFDSCTSLQQLNLNHFNTEKVTSMWNMFFWCTSLQQLDLSSFNTAKVQVMSTMFNNCQKLATLKLSENFVLDEMVEKGFMFDHCGEEVWGGGCIYYVTDQAIQSALSTETDFDNMHFSGEYRYFDSLQEFILDGKWVGNEKALFHYDLNYDGKVSVSDLTRWIWIENINK